jgi:hypothetical protein
VLYRLSYMSMYWCTSTVLHDSEIKTSILLDSSIKAEQWSGRRESNPRNQFGKLMFYH